MTDWNHYSFHAENINKLVAEIHADNLKAGWWHKGGRHLLKTNPLVVSNKLALIHSEISEAMEGDRKGQNDDKLTHRKMIEVELADAVIRIFDLCGALKLDLGGAIEEKRKYNLKRSDHCPANRAKAGGKKY